MPNNGSDAPAFVLANKDHGMGRVSGDNGIYFVGDKGVMLYDGWAGEPRLIPGRLT